MTNERELFHQEFGAYFQIVSEETPVGVCSDCLAVRSRSDVDPKEKCPSYLMRIELDIAEDATGTHQWQPFTERVALEAFVKERFPAFKELLDATQQRFQENASASD